MQIYDTFLKITKHDTRRQKEFSSGIYLKCDQSHIKTKSLNLKNLLRI
jgi:hypothetical protein